MLRLPETFMRRIVHGNASVVLPTIAPGTVDCAVSSPPYWNIRSYLRDDDPLKAFEIGSEPTLPEYVYNVVVVLRLVRDVLADHGTCWLNVGDTYSAAGSANLIPQRLAAALSDDGWIVRAAIVWAKPNPMPAPLVGWSWSRCQRTVKEGTWGGKGGKLMRKGQRAQPGLHARNGSTTIAKAEREDCPGCEKCKATGGMVLRRGSWRPTSAHESVLMLAKTPGYYADGVPVQTEAAEVTVLRDPANLRDVWTIASEEVKACLCPSCRGFQIDYSVLPKVDGKPTCRKCKVPVLTHHAAFPGELVEKCLLASVSMKGYCPECGMPWARTDGLDTSWMATCAHAKLEPRPGIVLDPFGGSGRTAVVAQKMGLSYVMVELNRDYVEMARNIVRHESPLFHGLES